MTILQLQIVVATAELKSLTAAAKQLNTTQSNASNGLKLLENSLGFRIFERSPAGVKLTPKGERFLSYARQMLDTNDKILQIRNEEEIYRLHLGVVNYYTAAEPFFTLLTEQRENDINDFLYCNVSVSTGIQKLMERELDIVVVPTMDHQITNLTKKCQQLGIEMTSICRIPTFIMVRTNHPAESDNRCANITQGCDLMKDYPYIGLQNMTDSNEITAYNDSDYIQCSYKMFTDDTNTRLRMIEASNGFGFGLMSSYRMMAHFALDYFRLPDVTVELFCLTRPRETQSRGISDYLELLRKEMRYLV